MIRLAIVEDSKTTREGLEKIINLSPTCRCICSCASGEEALEVLPEHKPEIVLMDIQLPGISGIDCVRKLKDLLPDVQVIMVTVYEDPDRIFRALQAGACGYILKRSKPQQILNAIQDVQDGGVPMTAEIARKVIAHFQNQKTTTEDVEMLSWREREVLELVEHGLSNKEIAERLNLTVTAIRWRLKHIYRKLQVHSRTEAAHKLRQNK